METLSQYVLSAFYLAAATTALQAVKPQRLTLGIQTGSMHAAHSSHYETVHVPTAS